jgi:hypothetical protein
MARDAYSDVLHNVAEEVYPVTPNQQGGRVEILGFAENIYNLTKICDQERV